MNFLEQVATKLYQRHHQSLHRLAVVFPNRRQSVFFRSYFLNIATAPAFVPELLTIEELVARSSRYPVAEPLVQAFGLYEAYRKVCIADGEDAEKLPDVEKFYPIGETLLKDFREIDAYQQDVARVCSTLYNIELIEKSFDQFSEEQKQFLKQFWSSVTNKGQAQERFLKLWKRLPEIYRVFHDQLEAQHLTTIGKAYLQLGAGQPTEPLFGTEWDHVAFVGFNAVNKSEELLIRRWQESGYASLWMDVDRYYLEDRKQEAGFFLRKNLGVAQLKNELEPLDIIGRRDDAITITEVQGHTAQAKIISNWLAQFGGQRLDSAAILLADETLLLPVLQSLPGNEVPVNVTLGFPIHQTALFSFINLFFTIQDDLALNRYRSLHYELVQQWLTHPLCDWSVDEARSLEEKIQSEVWIQVPVKNLQRKSELGNLVFLPTNAVMDVFGRLRQMLQLLQKSLGLQDDPLLQGSIIAAWQVFQALEPLFAGIDPKPSMHLVVQVIRRQLSGMTVPFEGEPLRGIQVMGLLESRGLDFEHVLVLGAGEGSLPRIAAPQTFLPDGVRRAFGLSVPEHQDSIFAYTFYRLLHRCQSMHLVYNKLVTDNSTGEVSRFMRQIEFETKMTVLRTAPALPIIPFPQPVITIQKTDDVMWALRRLFEGEKPITISPSQINSYLACRLQFFFKQVAMIKPIEKFSEEIDASTLGTIVHAMMEELYKGIQKHQGNNAITKESIDWMRQQIPLLIGPVFSAEWLGKRDDRDVDFVGMLDVVKQVVENYVHGFLDLDEAYAPFNLVDLEVKMNVPFTVTVDGEQKLLRLNGYIDRVDEKDGIYRMVDYKTGGDKNDFSSLEGLFERESRSQNKAALQTIIYSWMFRESHPTRQRFEPALLPLRQVRSSGNTSSRLILSGARSTVNADNIHDVLTEAELKLRQLLEELLDPAVPFDQTEDYTACKYCDYVGLCRRN